MSWSASHILDLCRSISCFSLIAKEQIKLPTATSALLPTATSALQTYLELVEYSHTVSALVPSSGLAISPFVREIAVETWTAMCKAMDAYVLLANQPSVHAPC